MLPFLRSETASAEKKTKIVDGSAAKAWLAGMAQPASLDNLAEIAQVLRALGAQGAGETTILEPQRKFAIVDRIRGLLLPTLTGGAVGEDRFTVLPIDDEYGKRFWAIADAMLALRDAYAWLVSQLPRLPTMLEDLEAEPPDGNVPHAAFVSGVGALHRALDVSAQLIVAVQRARWAVPALLWERHCVLGQLVRELDCQDVDVVDAQRLSATRTCRAAFVLPVLLALADPAARSGAEFEVVRMASQRWSAKIGFRLERRPDLGAAPARPVATPGPTAVLGPYIARFDTQATLASIDKRLEALAEGRTTRDVGIGDTLRAPAARELLISLRQRWGSKTPQDIDSPDRSWRASAPGTTVSAMIGMPAQMEALASHPGLGTVVATRAGQGTYDYRRGREGAITQSRAQVERMRIEQLLEHAETWTLAAESGDAVRCLRKHARPRIGLQRLVGLRLGKAGSRTPFLLGWVEALQGTTGTVDDGQVQSSSAHAIRVRLAPGIPQILIAAVEETELGAAFLLVPGVEREARQKGGGYAPLLSDAGISDELLPEDDTWDAVRRSPREYGLVLPLATFRPGRVVKAIRAGAVAQLRLEELMMRGSDFDLVRFTPL